MSLMNMIEYTCCYVDLVNILKEEQRATYGVMIRSPTCLLWPGMMTLVLNPGASSRICFNYHSMKSTIELFAPSCRLNNIWFLEQAQVANFRTSSGNKRILVLQAEECESDYTCCSDVTGICFIPRRWALDYLKSYSSVLFENMYSTNRLLAHEPTLDRTYTIVKICHHSGMARTQ